MKIKSTLFILCILMIGLLFGCSKTEQKKLDYIKVPEDTISLLNENIGALNITELSLAGQYVKAVANWYNDIRYIDKLTYEDYNNDNISDLSQQILEIQDAKNAKTDDEINKLNAIFPCISIAGEISKIYLESNGDFKLNLNSSSKNENYINITDEDWDNLKSKIEEAIEFYYPQ